MSIDDYDRRKDDRLEAGLCQWCGHAWHEGRQCAMHVSGRGWMRPCVCGASEAKGKIIVGGET